MRWLAGFTLLFGLVAVGQAQEIQGGYVGLSLGSFKYEEQDEFGVLLSDTSGMYKLLGGYHFNTNYALEASWGIAGDLGEAFYGSDTNGNAASFRIEGEYEIRTLRLMMLAPSGTIGMFGGIGVFDSSLDTTFSFQSAGGTESGSTERTDSGATVVGGMLFDLRHLSVRGEYEWFDTDSGTDAANIAVSVIFRF